MFRVKPRNFIFLSFRAISWLRGRVVGAREVGDYRGPGPI